jgi:hypothetical protein
MTDGRLSAQELDEDQKRLTHIKTGLEIEKLRRDLKEIDNIRLHRWTQLLVTLGGIIAGIIVTYFKSGGL